MRHTRAAMKFIALPISVMVVSSLTAVGAAATTARAPLSAGAVSVDDARAIRHYAGLDTSDAQIRAAAASVQPPGSPLPIPLTPAERRKLDRGGEVGTALSHLMTAATNGQFPELASIDADPRTDAVTIGLTTDNPTVRKRITAALPSGATFRVRSASTPWARLESLRGAIGADMGVLTAHGVAVQQVTHDWASDAVVAYVSGSLATAREALVARYGSAGLKVEKASAPALPGAWARHASNGPAIGGQNLIAVTSGTTQGISCTITGGARNPSTGALWLVTAGHCAPPGKAWYMGDYTSGDHLGSNPVSAPWQSADTYCDCTLIDNSDPGRLNNYTLNATNNLQAETSNATAGLYGPKKFICTSSAGTTNGVRCGHMVGGTDYTLCLNFPPSGSGCQQTSRIHDAVFTDMPVCHGDSGSPVTIGATWVGIVSTAVSNPPTGCGTQMIFSKTIYLQSQYGVQLLTFDI